MVGGKDLPWGGTCAFLTLQNQSRSGMPWMRGLGRGIAQRKPVPAPKSSPSGRPHPGWCRQLCCDQKMLEMSAGNLPCLS